jgi:hypothetical protein
LDSENNKLMLVLNIESKSSIVLMLSLYFVYILGLDLGPSVAGVCGQKHEFDI